MFKNKDDEKQEGIRFDLTGDCVKRQTFSSEFENGVEITLERVVKVREKDSPEHCHSSLSQNPFQKVLPFFHLFC